MINAMTFAVQLPIRTETAISAINDFQRMAKPAKPQPDHHHALQELPH